MLLRRYDPARDADACLSIWRDASRAGHPFLEEAALEADAVLVRDVYLPKAEIVVAEEDGRVVGFVALLDAFIGGLFVDPTRHGGGVGRALVLDAASRKGALDVEVYEANAGALAFYVRLGFVETGRRETDDQGRAHPVVRLRRAS
ncbi:GNAT family N-acetyltransferase [Salinarimonas rosea]|uniref:GNAT family N-acetyltransferase n=1 Tax=Salinarimonas rosea TaxID=552063 RepID=UPI0004080564|nr:GNAT family N-acetyltransferase [Salinarimonas rosea]